MVGPLCSPLTAEHLKSCCEETHAHGRGAAWRQLCPEPRPQEHAPGRMGLEMGRM